MIRLSSQQDRIYPISRMTTAEQRRWALDMFDNYKDTKRADKARAHADQMLAAADLSDAEADYSPQIADECIIEQVVPICGKIKIKGGRRIAIERPYNGEGESCGIYTAWEWRDDPTAEDRTGLLIRLYIGSIAAGPLAQYNAEDNQWYDLTSKGNYGKRYACGGTWSSKKTEGEPIILKKLEDIMEKEERIAKAKAKLEAAKKRVFAAHQMDMASGYERQATHPAYPGQEIVCMGKAQIVRSLAGQTLAEAELIEAQI